MVQKRPSDADTGCRAGGMSVTEEGCPKGAQRESLLVDQVTEGGKAAPPL